MVDDGSDIYYSTDNENWTKYMAQLDVTANGTYYFKATDSAGNKGINSITFANIDTTAPVITLTGDNTTPLQASTLTASVDDGSPIYYRIGDAGEWTEYKEALAVTANATYYFKATDIAGNEGTAEYVFANIDTTAPVITLFGDNQMPLQSSTLTATTEAGLEIFYSTDNATWIKYEGEISVSANATYYFKATDAAGNVGTAEFTFANIDTTAPEAPIVSADITDATNQNVTVTAVFSDDSVVKEYSLDSTTWLAYTAPITFEENRSVSFRGMDAAGNISETTGYTVGNIDRIAPVRPTASADVTAPTNGDVFVSAVFSDDSVTKEYSLDGQKWLVYADAIKFSENGSVFFRGTDAAGNVSDVTDFTVDNIDKVAPDKPTASADVTTATNGAVFVSASFSDDSVVKEYSLDGETWLAYTEAIKFTENGSVSFRGTDEAGNVSEITNFLVNNIDKTAPEKPLVSADITMPTNRDVTVTAIFSDDSVTKEYSLDGQNWFAYTEAIVLMANGTVFFRGADEAGNVSAEETYTVDCIDKEPPVIVLSGDNTTPLQASTLIASTEAGLDIFYSMDNATWTKYTGEIAVSANATYYFKAADAAGNTSTAEYVFGNIVQAPASEVIPQTQTWEKVEDAAQYVVEYSTDNFEHVIRLTVDSNSLDSFRMPAGNYQMRVKADGGEEWTVATPVVAEEASDEPKLIKSNADGHTDVFFVNTVGTWESGYVAQHVGSTDDDTWGGTEEYASLFGKNKLTDIIEGSTTDANVLLMSVDANGDALFVDDIYSESPNELGLSQSRIAQIDEIRAGAGNDVVDMTSQRFEYIGEGLTIRGGDGNDTIWANKGNNFLFGDAGNDRIIGASGNDVIVGGIGKDSMHGGGGKDTFTFCENWGVDNVEQLADGEVVLWFAEGSFDNWDATSLTYTDGTNSVKVSGVTAEQVTLKFGDDGSDEYKALASAGAFFDATTERIFEEEGKGMLASL